LNKGRKNYASNLAGAYYAAKLSILDHLKARRRQAGAIAFLEVRPEWIPLGVWRFREIARDALNKAEPVGSTDSLENALKTCFSFLETPSWKWLKASKLISYLKAQIKLDAYLT